MNLTIGEIAAACGGELVVCGEQNINDTCVTSLVIDSRKAEQGGAFLATVGERVDGHKFISQVFAAGAVLAVTEKTPEQVQQETGVDCGNWGSYVLVKDSFQALKDIAEAYRKKLSVKIVGITGSVGKTSTKEFIAGVLAQKYNVLKTEGNFNNEVGVPLTLLRIRQEHQVAVVEMGISDFGEMHRLSKMVRPNVCVITNIGQCHLENLKTRDGILQAKSEIFDFMAEDGEICLNGDDDKLCGIGEIKGKRPHFFGLGESMAKCAEDEKTGCAPAEEKQNKNDRGVKLEVKATDIKSRGLFGSDATLLYDLNKKGVAVGKVEPRVPLPGKHMVLNAAAAACVARLFQLSEEQIAAGIAGIRPVSGRNNLIPLEKYTLIDDCYNANPASMKAAIDLLTMADTEKVAILGDMFELGENAGMLHGEVGAYAAKKGIDRILFVGELSEQGFFAATDYAEETVHAVHFPTRESLFSCLAQEREEYIPDGSTVLIKASHGMKFDEVLEFLKKECVEA